MTFLDKVHRDYLYKHKFKNGEIIAVKSVAGSGKTTTLLELAKIHSNKRILYIAFNKSLISEIKDKIKERGLKNMFPVTFDSLMRTVFIIKTKIDNEHLSIIDLKPQNIGFYISWFANKPYRIKNFYIKCYNKFCNQTKYNNIKDFSERILGGDKGLLTKMWQKTLDHDMLTFDSIRKLVEINNWCVGYIDANYDMIFIDESQDFDNIMLKILLEDTTIPKLFVGDTRQAIYEWKGCINAFDKLPDHSLILEFYSTFRVGLPACDEIREKFEHCYMISKSNNVTVIEYDNVPDEKYTYLFRSWRNLLKTASVTSNIWIHNFNSQIEYIKRLHNKLQISPLDQEEYSEFSDDLPKFLLKLSAEELEKMINNIEKNIVKKEDCVVELYTIHSYKGLENNIIRIFNDIDIAKEQNLYYVALTRGIKKIIIDSKKVIFENEFDNKKQIFFKKVGSNSIILE
jgi:ATP-dependent exoDNAse (exonuclease V) beta subunit